MPTPLRRRLRRVRRGLGYSAAIALIALAVLLALVGQVLPLAESHPDRIAAWLGERAGRPVRFDAVETEWTRRGPLLRLDNLRIGEGEQAITLGDTDMLVSIYAGLLPGTPFSELRLHGLDLTLERGPDRRWRVRGLPGGDNRAGDPLEALEPLGELQVIGGKLAISAPQLGIDARIPRVDLRLRVQDDRLRVGVRAWPTPEAAPLDAALSLDRNTGDGRAWAGAGRADLAAWSPLLRLAGVAVGSGRGRIQAWARLRDHRLAAITVDAALRDVGLHSAATGPAERVDFQQLQARLRWQRVDGGWRVDAPRLRFDDGRGGHVLDGLLLAGGERMAMAAPRVDGAPLLRIAALSDRVAPGLRRWLRRADPRVVLREVEAAGVRGGPLRVRARIETLGFAPVGDAPGVQGLSGVLLGDADGFVLDLDEAGRTTVDWPSGFGTAHTMTLDGRLGGWRHGEGWAIGTSSLRLAGEGFGMLARGGLRWQGDGTRPWIDVAVDLDPTRLPVAKGFWLRHRMSETLVGWLDAALVGGILQDGRVVIAGDLDDWPFTANNGRFEARARLEDATVRFQPGWAPVEQLDADLAFIGDGFSVDGEGRIGQVRVGKVQAGIDHYGGGRLRVDADAAGDAGQLLRVLRRSPLRASHAETLDSLTAAGPVQARFGLTLPLQPGVPTRIDGSVILDDARLVDARWDLMFDRVSGRAEYDQHGFDARALRVRHRGRPGTLSLRAGRGHVDEPGNALEAQLATVIGSDELLERASQLAWLQPYLHGRSEWQATLEVPAGAGAAGARMRLRSDLRGTALTLPAPLRKPAGESLPARVEVPLPLDDGEIRVALGERMSLRARSSDAGTGVRIVLGRDTVEQPPPADGLVATGRTDHLDAIEWIALVRGGDAGAGDGGGGLPLRRIDVSAGQLQLLGGSFAETRVRVTPGNGESIEVRADGPALAGELAIGDGRGVQGRFQRMHWRPAGGTADGSGASPAAAAAPREGEPFDPARLPALDLRVDDLRLVDASLGEAVLRTRPVAGGLRIEQMQSRTAEGVPRQWIDLSGSWTGRGPAARTRMTLAIQSADVGALLDGLGGGGRVAGGDGSLRFEAGWPGSPADFGLEALQGQLEFGIDDGRLLEVDPGAGRVLGLLSIAELPRRLTLDFGDFFYKGFSFNTIGGRVRFAEGVARTDDLRIDGPAAVIDIRGAAHLRAETYDQTIEVRPKTGNLLTVAGALAAGPVGAALGAAANAMLQKPLGELAARTYRVTGPWADPKVQVSSRELPEAAPAPAPPPAATADSSGSTGPAG